MLRIVAFFALSSVVLLGLTRDELALLRDAGGWEYQTITDANNGFETQATCFDQASTGQCRGNLLFRPDGSFTQTISAHGRSMHRGGKYAVTGNDVTFWDEHGTKDGPYHVSLDPVGKSLRVETTQAGVKVQMDLLLESEFKKQMHEKKK
jgi:hypothetical protein